MIYARRTGVIHMGSDRNGGAMKSGSWPAVGGTDMLKVREIPLKRLKPWKDNPRRNEQAVKAVARSIEQFGFNVPILCDESFTIIAGHARWKAAKMMNMTSVPAIVLHMTDVQRRAFSIADNRTARIAEWEFSKLEEILKRLRSEDVNLSSLGYSDAELEALLDPEDEFDWDVFDEQRAGEQNPEYVLVPVKIRHEMKGIVTKAIRACASEYRINKADPAITAGLVLLRLLGLPE